ncbi:MAG: hypothetical protein QOE63_3 [Acidimicrobiaceae bacterium]
MWPLLRLAAPSLAVVRAHPMTALPSELTTRDRAPHVGRSDELAALRAAWQRAIIGDRRLVLVGGEPGIGKTRLAGELAGLLRDGDTLVLHGRCDPEAIFPYQPFAEALQPLAADADLFSRGVDRAALFAACAAILRSATNEQPVLLVIDDVHWATGATLALLRHLFRSLLSARLLILVTYRDTEVARPGPLADLLADLRTEAGVDRLALAGLDRGAISALVDAIVDTSDLPDRDGFVTDLERDTGGNPFFLGEVLRDLRETRQRTTAVPASVHDVLAVRIGRLPESTRQHLTAAAAIGPRFDLALLSNLELDGDALDAIEPAVDARLVLEDPSPPGRFRFAHALVRQSLLEDMGPTREARLHEQIGGLLEAAGAQPAEIAAHDLGAARPALVERGARYALQAASSVTWRSAPEVAAQLAANAAQALQGIEPHDVALEVELLCEQAMALIVLQRNAEFLSIVGRAVDVARASGDDRLLAQAVATRGCYTPTGNTDFTFITDIEDALAKVDPADRALRARLLCGLATAEVCMVLDRHTALAHAREAAALGDEVGDLFDRWNSRFVGSLAAMGEPDPAVLAQLGHELVAVGAECDDENSTCHGLRALATHDLMLGDIDAFVSKIAETEGRWRVIGNVFGAGVGIVGRYVAAAARGDWPAAEATLNEMLDWGVLDPNFTAAYAAEYLGLREVQGRRAEIEPMVGAVAASMPSFPSLRIAHGLALHELGRTEEAVAICRDVVADPAFLLADYGELSRLAWTVELAATTGALDLLPSLVESLRAWEGLVLVVNVGIGILGKVDAYLGLGHAALGDHDRADQLFTGALAWEVSSGCRPFAARTRLWWAQSLADRDPAQALELLEACTATCDELEIVSVGAQARVLRRSLTTSGL